MLADAPPKSRWFAPERDLDAEKAICEALGLPSLVCAALVARGVRFPEQAQIFLNPKLEDLHEPLLLPDAQAAVDEIMLAKERAEIIYVHGDYDVDGVTSTAIWTRSLRKLGFNVIAHVPHRMKEGYGIHQSAVQAAIDSGAKLFLTCDCGTGAVDMVEMAREAGMRVVVTDHHEIGPKMPRAQAVVNPHRSDSQYPFTELCGAAVAFKIAQAVAEACGAKREQFIRAYLDLVCLGTIADVVPLIGENRILASFGLKSLSTTKKKGLTALMSVAEVDPKKGVTAHDVGWRLGPRLNAAGRVDDAELSLRLLLTEDDAEALELATALNEHNLMRREEEHRILAHANEMILENGFDKNPLIMVAAPGWHPGVIGIVAGRIVEKYFRPALVASIDEENGSVRGSARSIPAFHLHNALQDNRDLFLSCGGHARAAGFSLEIDKLDDAIERLINFARERLSPEDLIPTFAADAVADISEFDLSAFRALEQMRPFGEANPIPHFIVRGCRLENIRPCANPDHIQFTLNCKQRISGIGFNMGTQFEGLSQDDPVDLLIKPGVDSWNGQLRAKLYLQALLRA